MSATNWGKTDYISAIKRAGGRKAWNARRMRVGRLKRLRAIAIFMELGGKHGAQAEAARRLGVHRSFVCRALAMWFESQRKEIPLETIEEYRTITYRLDKRQSRGRNW